MKTKAKLIAALFGAILIGFATVSCTKSTIESSLMAVDNAGINSVSANAPTPAMPDFNLEVILRGEGNGFGHVKFRQANDVTKIIDLGVWVRDLEPNHAYYLQRAVDTPPADGSCVNSAWLTLGYGLSVQPILTDDKGTGQDDLWRELPSTILSGTTFDIHFQVIDALTKEVVLSSSCYQYTVR